MKTLSTLQSIYTNTKICVPKTLNICMKSEVLWSQTFIKTPENNLYQLHFDGMDYHTKSLPTTAIDSNNLKCFSGEPDFERLMAGGELTNCQNNIIIMKREIC